MGFAAKVKTGANLNPIGASLFGTCTTQASTQAKVAEITGLNSLTNMEGLTIHVYFANANESDDPAPTLTVTDGTFSYGPKAIRRAGNSPAGGTPKTSWNAGSILSLTFYGDEWYITGWLNDDTLYSNATVTTAGLMSASDKVKMNMLSTDVNIDILTSSTAITIDDGDWAADTSGTGGAPKYADYPYRAVVNVPYVEAEMIPQAIFNPDDIAAYGIAPIAEAIDDYLYFYAEVLPDTDITIPVTLMLKGRAWSR